jgi:hypothetical protein
LFAQHPVNQPVTHVYFQSIAWTLLLREKLKENLPISSHVTPAYNLSKMKISKNSHSASKDETSMIGVGYGRSGIISGVQVDINVATEEEKFQIKREESYV